MINKIINNSGIKCDLYTVYNTNKGIEHHKLSKAKIIGKNIFISKLQEYLDPDNKDDFCEYSFDYSYTIPFDLTISSNKKKEKKLNTKITYENSSGNKSSAQVCYTYLTRYNKIINSWNFRKLWIQQSSNITWIINILVALLAIIATISTQYK
ncbi:MAG: hypothetical protein DRI89_02665 [Bacteroidetes bacterium]|nr:MAG: hypothetical protein DRI89_02665 [Bacteroidota bacterium]